MENEQPESLRDTLSANLEIAEAGGDLSAPPEKPPVTATVETEEQKAGRTANRLRDDSGRLLPGKKDATAPASPPNQTAPASSQAAPQAAVAPITRPASWKKDYWEAFDKIATENPELAKYIHQREGEFASGVSTYKQEAENARQLNDAIAPFLPQLQQHGIQTTQWIKNLGTAHERLALGSPAEKVAMGVQLIRDYGIDPQALFQAISNPQYQAPAPQQAQFNPQQFESTVQAKVEAALTQREIQSEYQQFINAKDQAGNPLYPHFEAVKDTMAGLLQAELAQDYKSAYEAALRHPRHAEIYDAMQTQQRAQEDAERLAKQQAVVTHKRSQAVSVKSSTPVGATPINGKSSLRDQLSEAFDSVGTGRV